MVSRALQQDSVDSCRMREPGWMPNAARAHSSRLTRCTQNCCSKHVHLFSSSSLALFHAALPRTFARARASTAAMPFTMRTQAKGTSAARPMIGARASNGPRMAQRFAASPQLQAAPVAPLRQHRQHARRVSCFAAVKKRSVGDLGKAELEVRGFGPCRRSGGDAACVQALCRQAYASLRSGSQGSGSLGFHAAPTSSCSVNQPAC